MNRIDYLNNDGSGEIIMPTVSVIMGIYNGENKMDEAIQSILNQSFDDFEFIICDDCSCDNTLLKLRQWKKKDKRIIVLHNDTNRQLAYSLNKCLEQAKGIYIARMDDDDYALPARFEKQVEFLNENPKYDIVGSAAYLVDENGIYGERSMTGEISSKDILKGKSFIHPSVMIRREALIGVQGYKDDASTRRAEDLDLWCRLYNNGSRGYVLEEKYLNYFESQKSMKRRKYRYRINEFKIRKNLYDSLDTSPAYLIYVVKPLIVGLLPNSIMKVFHARSKGKRRIK